MKGNTFSTWGIQSYPHFVQRKWKTLKKTESRYSHALKTRVEFRFREVKFTRSGGVSDRGAKTHGNTCAAGRQVVFRNLNRHENACSIGVFAISCHLGCCVSLLFSAILHRRQGRSEHGFPHRFPGLIRVFNVFHIIQRGIHYLKGGMNLIECR